MPMSQLFKETIKTNVILGTFETFYKMSSVLIKQGALLLYILAT